MAGARMNKVRIGRPGGDAPSGIHAATPASERLLGCQACVACGTINLAEDWLVGNVIRRRLPEACAGCGAKLRKEVPA
jgi:hypothetical protein